MGILPCEQNFRDVWRRNKNVRGEIGNILRTHKHTHAAKLVVRIRCTKFARLIGTCPDARTPVAGLRVRAAGSGTYVRALPAELAVLLEFDSDRRLSVRPLHTQWPRLLARRASHAPVVRRRLHSDHRHDIEVDRLVSVGVRAQ